MFDSAFNDGAKRPGTREMTALLAGLMALNAFAIDSMIPALADIGRSLHVAHENDQQLVVIAYSASRRHSWSGDRWPTVSDASRSWRSASRSTAPSHACAPLRGASRC